MMLNLQGNHGVLGQGGGMPLSSLPKELPGLWEVAVTQVGCQRPEGVGGGGEGEGGEGLMVCGGGGQPGGDRASITPVIEQSTQPAAWAVGGDGHTGGAPAQGRVGGGGAG
jgi:hypothetical protein